MAKKDKGRHAWIYTKARRHSTELARAEHVRLVKLGKQVRARQRD